MADDPAAPPAAPVVRPLPPPADWFADEVAVDFPAMGPLVDRMRARFLGEADGAGAVRAEVRLTPAEASAGRRIALSLPIQRTCRACGGRGETWNRPCPPCAGSGLDAADHVVRLHVPAGVRHGTCLSYRLDPGDGPAAMLRVTVWVAGAARARAT